MSRDKFVAGVRLIVIGAALLSAQGAWAQGSSTDYERAASLQQRLRGKVYKERISPNWFDDNRKFWYRNDLKNGTREFVLVDTEKGVRSRAFDHAALAAALSKTAETQVDPKKLPFSSLTFLDHNSIRFAAFGSTWVWDKVASKVKPYRRPEDEPDARSASLAAQSKIRRSASSEMHSEVTFVNSSDTAVELMWIDYDGGRNRYAALGPGKAHRQHTYVGHVWLVCRPGGKAVAVFTAKSDRARAEVTQQLIDSPKVKESRRNAGRPRGTSPDGQWKVYSRDHNLWLESPETRKAAKLTTDGSAEHHYTGEIYWSPDSKHVVAMRRRPGSDRRVHLIESSPKDQLQPKLHSHRYRKPGDDIDIDKPHLFNVEDRKQVPISDALFDNPWSLSNVHWSPDSSAFMFLYNQRGHQAMRVIRVRAEDGKAEAVIREEPDTFVDHSRKTYLRYLDETNEILWQSERDGWNHLYLYDIASRELKQITRGPWVVRQVENIDTKRRQIRFWAGGIHSDQDPYYLHLCRVNFDGSDFLTLTEGNGTHEVEYSPDGKTFIDRYSRVDMPSVHELRSLESGELICKLEEADCRQLRQTGWQPPEPFVAKGRDGKTDIYGIIIRPTNFDPERKYPVIEKIYAGPHSSHVPKSFGLLDRQQTLAELGFVIVQIDGMGTSNRSKAFHDVCWKNLADAGFPDRIAWMKAAAEKYPSLDLTRVGIYGGSAGGQNALGALLFHGEFYKAAAADCGCHDNRMDKIWWNEQWMGWPLGPHYEAQSNITNAHKLQGDLLLTVGELDRNVDPASTLQVVNALIKAGKDFEFFLVPGGGHGIGEAAYLNRKRMDFFVESLHGVKPPDRNKP